MTVGIWTWLGLIGGIVALSAVDLALGGGSGPRSFRRALVWSAGWLTLGLGFGGVLWLWAGTGPASAYTAGYLIEKSLSLDNVFVWTAILGGLAVPRELQRRVLFWGITGALVLRGAFIATGTAVVEAFHGVLYALAAILIVTAARMAWRRDDAHAPEEGLALRALRRIMPMTSEYEGERLVVRRGGRRVATPLLAALVAVAATDVAFAVDSIPAVFSVTTDPFLVFTSNALAVLGLRAMHEAIAPALLRFRYLPAGLAAILGLAGVKLALVDLVHVPIAFSIGAIAVALAAAIGASLLRERRDAVTAHLALRTNPATTPRVPAHDPWKPAGGGP